MANVVRTADAWDADGNKYVVQNMDDGTHQIVDGTKITRVSLIHYDLGSVRISERRPQDSA